MSVERKEKIRKKVHVYLKYSGLGFQLAGLVILGLFVGKWIDSSLNLDKPIFAMLLILIFFSGFMYKLYMELFSEK